MPSDFQVLLLGEWVPRDLDDGIPVIEMSTLASDEARIEDGWAALRLESAGLVVKRNSTPPSGADHRSACTCMIELVMPNSNDLYETALCYAVIRGGYPEEAAIEASDLRLMAVWMGSPQCAERDDQKAALL